MNLPDPSFFPIMPTMSVEERKAVIDSMTYEELHEMQWHTKPEQMQFLDADCFQYFRQVRDEKFLALPGGWAEYQEIIARIAERH